MTFAIKKTNIGLVAIIGFPTIVGRHSGLIDWIKGFLALLSSNYSTRIFVPIAEG